MLWEKNNKYAVKWAKEDENVIIKLWNDGYTGYEIARHLKTTRSAILGKINRMRKNGVVFEREHTPKAERVAAAKPRRAPHPKKPKIAVIPKTEIQLPKIVEPVVLPNQTREPIKFAQLTNKTCKYSVSGNLPHDYLFCGEPVHKNCFCEYHFKICYTGRMKSDNSTKSSAPVNHPSREGIRTHTYRLRK